MAKRDAPGAEADNSYDAKSKQSRGSVSAKGLSLEPLVWCEVSSKATRPGSGSNSLDDDLA